MNDARQPALALFVVAAFLGAALTFLLQPFVAKAILPLFGGTPSVWNTCMLFFQALLLAGYGYAHAVGSSRRARRLIAAHIGLMLLPLTVLPIHIGYEWAPAPDGSPTVWQLWLLLATVGLPFFAVSATAPLLQRWLSFTRHERAHDPYFLYAASNLGSLLALLAYPALLEPAFDLTEVARIWTAGYLALVVLMAACAVLVSRSPTAAREMRAIGADAMTAPRDNGATCRRVAIGLPLRWIALAAVPSSLMLSVTTYISTDVAAAPLLWVVPLAIYLLTFVLAFAPGRPFSVALVERSVPLVVILLAISLLARGLELPPWAMFTLHLGGLLWIAMACHGQLADLRPPVARLTEYYFWIATGGLLGGAFNALVAPALFTGITEYPIALVAACLLRRPPADAGENALPATARGLLVHDLVPALLPALAALVLTAAAPVLGLGSGPQTVGLTLGVPALACYLLLIRPVRFALAVGALFVTGAWLADTHEGELFARRTYYGVHRVRREDGQNRLYHGRTLHGSQSAEGSSPGGPPSPAEPLAYYHRSGPAGALFRTLEQEGRTPGRVGVVGLGVGSLAAYGRPGQRWTFYELDPTVLFVARESGHFTFLRDTAADIDTTLGDARINLSRAPEQRFDLLVLDAFSSDAVPVHLLTREALALYRGRLSPGGTLAFHISNRFLDLETVLRTLAHDARMDGVVWADLVLTEQQRRAGKLPSQWVVLSEDASLPAALISAGGGWIRLGRGPSGPLWTDGYSNLLGALRWRGGEVPGFRRSGAPRPG